MFHPKRLLFSDNFEQTGSGLVNGWTTCPGCDTPFRARYYIGSLITFYCAAPGDGLKGLCLVGSLLANPDASAQVSIPTQGLSAFYVSYDKHVYAKASSGDPATFVSAYSLDGTTFIPLENNSSTASIVYYNEPQSNFTIPNPGGSVTLTLRFFINANSSMNRGAIDNLVVTGSK